MKEDIFSKMIALVPEGSGMELPPRIFVDMEAEFIEFNEGESLIVRFPNKERYKNPFGFMQGGIITAAIDNTVSSFSYVMGPANITKEISTTYKRPVKSTEQFIDVVATMAEKTSTGMTLKAEVINAKGKLMASALVYCVFIKNRGEKSE